ncbi:hypothetical protein LOTGIDRAFT_156824 [Lottia gigantea]|uniref:Fe2OG dioxygenase domain-containing protein n=1 Tax=Lottia gigantea TaxID=225164 RepID=V4AYV7_LOTGI|nr:hypothetical protein LOTGIDRAFT_156824 [Lottia gigantea]ESP02873.1 hypothetical protein LOTGIDRAFT_156824 [Lottia gigantea]
MIPDTIIYIPNFISQEEEQKLIDHVYSAPKPKWTHLSNRRLQNWGGLPHPKGMVAEDIPQWLDLYCDKIGKLDLFEGKKPNHVLVNEYSPGQGIMPHEDGPLFYPTVTTISLGSSTVLDFYTHINQGKAEDKSEPCSENMSKKFEDRHVCSVYLEPRSLVIVKDDMYTKYLHGIKEQTEDMVDDRICNIKQCSDINIDNIKTRQTRISLTIRLVPKVLKTKLFFGKK